jgi:hypothetical protein
LVEESLYKVRGVPSGKYAEWEAEQDAKPKAKAK